MARHHTKPGKVPLGRVIARRTLQLVKPRRELVLEIGQPFKAEVDWACPYRIKGLDGGRVRAAFGIDSAQALELVFQAVRGRMEAAGGRVTWFDRPASLMFVRPIPNWGDDKFYLYLCRLVDREAKAWGRRAEKRNRSRSVKR